MPTSSNPLIPWMWDSSPNRTSTNTKETKEKDDESWDEVRAFKDDIGSTAGTTWPPRCYTCSFCSRDFGSAQALGGHMNVHRRDRAMIRLQKQQEELLFCSMKRYQYSFDSNGYYVVDGNELAGYNTVPCFMSTPGTELLQRRSEAVVSQNICTEDGCSGNSLLMNSVTHGKFGDAVCVESDDDDDDKSLKKLETCVMSSNLLLHQEQNGEREAKDLTTYKDFHSSRKGTEGPQERIDLELRLGSN